MPSISCIEKIAILTYLILKYCPNLRHINAVKLAKELVYTMNELNRNNISLRKLAIEFVKLFPKYWQRRTQFLLIITKYFPEILNILQKKDIIEVIEKRQYNCLSNELAQQIDISKIKNNIAIFEAQDIFEESQYITQIVKKNQEKRIVIVSPDSAFSELLYNNFEIENIPIDINFEHFKRETIFPFLKNSKEYSCPNQEFAIFLAEIKKYFSNFDQLISEDFPKLVMLLLEFFQEDKHENANISIVKISEIKYHIEDVMIMCGMNETDWKSRVCGQFWLHELLRKKLGLLCLEDFKRIIEDDFYAAFNNITDIYLTRTIKNNGIAEDKSSILAKFEAICAKKQVKIKYDCAEQENYTLSIQDEHNKYIARLPEIINAQSIELLIQSVEGFFAKEILGLSIVKQIPYDQRFPFLFKNLLYNYFENQDSKMEVLLEKIKSIDIFNFQKCKNVLLWLKKNYALDNAKNNIKGEMTVFFENGKVNIYSYADRIVANKLIIFRASSIDSEEDILHGKKGTIMTSCLIAQKSGFCNRKIDIENVEIWSLSNDCKNPLEIKKIAMTEQLISDFECKLKCVLSDFVANEYVSKYQEKDQQTKYKHFERA